MRTGEIVGRLIVAGVAVWGAFYTADVLSDYKPQVKHGVTRRTEMQRQKKISEKRKLIA